MPDESTVPAGWYPTPDGGTRYWDGSRWLALPAPDATAGALAHTDLSPESLEGSEHLSGRAVSNLVEPKSGRGNGVRSPKKVLLAVLVTVIVLGSVTAGVLYAFDSSEKAREAEASRSAAVEADEAAEEAAADAEAAQAKKDRAERLERDESVTGIETSIKEMAQGHVDDGIIDGPILDATCSPVSGGSTDDLTEATTAFECFVATEDIGDGKMTGYTYNATMNWATFQYTYGLGDA
jgi:type II secretory pathway pseudopilin PulG